MAILNYTTTVDAFRGERKMSRKDEIIAVKNLGERIGYGNMMDIASALWSKKMSDKVGKPCVMHMPTVEGYMTEEGKEVA